MLITSLVTKSGRTQLRCYPHPLLFVIAVVFCFLYYPNSLQAEEDTPTIKRLLSSSIDLLVQQKPHAANTLLNQIQEKISV